MEKLEFMMSDGGVVGAFRMDDYPRLPGRYPYEPYRGPGHLAMQERLKSGAMPRCHYLNNDDAPISFIVRSCPEYGVLELCDFLTD